MQNGYSEVIEEMAMKLLNPCVGKSEAPKIWDIVKENVVAAVNKVESFSDYDVSLALGKELRKRMDILTPNQYQELAMKTCSIRDTALRTEDGVAITMLDNSMLGLCGETGECADMLKKYLYQEHDFDKTHMAKELGDVAWYLAEAAEAIGYSLEDIFRMNIDKLKARYPEGHFDSKRSQHRKEDDV